MLPETISLPLDVKGVANLILDWSEQDKISVSPMKLQKLIFFSHADFLIHFKTPLIKQEFEAWDYGPVIPSIYQEFKINRDAPIVGRALAFDPKTATRRVAVCGVTGTNEVRLRSLYDFYKTFSATELSDLSHMFQGAWRHARSLFSNGLNMDRRISNDMIVRFHRPIHT